LEDIPIENPSPENNALVASVFDYYKDKRLTGRLLLIKSGMIFSKVKIREDLLNAIKNIGKLTGNAPINLAGFQAADLEKYTGWVVPNIYNSCKKNADDLIKGYKLFNHTEISPGFFISICAKEVLKGVKENKDFDRVLVFLEFLFSVESAEGRKETGEILRKLSKKELENIDKSVREYFKDKESCLELWKGIHEIALTKESLIQSLKQFVMGT
jgi:hypothetical protein